MKQSQVPVLEALRQLARRPIAGFGGPGHHLGRGATRDIVKALGTGVFQADTLTPKGLDDRTESAKVLQRAYQLATDAWGGDLCRFSTGGSTQSIQTALSAVAGPGDTVLVAANAHWAVFNTAVFAGIDARVVSVAYDRERNIEHGVEPLALANALAANPHAKAVVVVSPTVYGVTSDIAALAKVCHARNVPLIVDAAWGAAFGFSRALPRAATADGADIMVCSLHKTLGALAQGSIMVVRGDLVDTQRFATVFDMYESTSPSVPIIASIDAARREHALHGERVWGRVARRARTARKRLAGIRGITVYGREMLDGAGAIDLDETKIAIAVAPLGMTGYQADEWLQRKRRISMVLSDMDTIVAAIGVGTTNADVDRLVRGVRALRDAARCRDERFTRPPAETPVAADPAFEAAAMPPAAFYGRTELIPIADAANRIAAEVVAPSPPATPRLIPGQRITPAHVAFLTAHLSAGAFIPDPSSHGTDMVRVTRTS